MSSPSGSDKLISVSHRIVKYLLDGLLEEEENEDEEDCLLNVLSVWIYNKKKKVGGGQRF